MVSSLSPIGLPATAAAAISAKTPADYPPQGLLVHQFDTYREGYGGAVVKIFQANTTTLLPCYSDPALTIPVENPQVLVTRVDDAGREYGRFASSIYVPYPYHLQIDDDEQSGIVRQPLDSLNGEDASYAEVTVSGSSRARQLRDVFADVIAAQNYGAFGASRDTNTSIINSAISAAALLGGGKVFLPSGTIPILPISIPENVYLIGAGRSITTLSCESTGKIITLAGDNCGLSSLTLNGIQKVTGSIGVYGKARVGIAINDVLIKAFDTGVLHQGGRDHRYTNASVSDCTKGARLLGDEDYTGTGGGSEWSGLLWDGGTVELTTSVGIELAMRDLPCRHNMFNNINFQDNIGSDGALLIYGARHTRLQNAYWDNNSTNIDVEDHADTRLADRQVVGLFIDAGQMDGGTAKFDGLCQDITLADMQLSDVTIEANIPINSIVLRNCVENSTLFTGDSTKVVRHNTTDLVTVKGTTTDGTAKVVYKKRVPAGAVTTLIVTGTAEKQNATTGRASFQRIATVHTPPASLDYDELSASFSAGALVQGATSGATGILSAAASSATGTLRIGSLTGDFIDDELITAVSGTGQCRANGTLYYSAATLLGSVTSVHAVGDNTGSPPAGWALSVQAAGQEAQVIATGAASSDVVWSITVQEASL